MGRPPMLPTIVSSKFEFFILGLRGPDFERPLCDLMATAHRLLTSHSHICIRRTRLLRLCPLGHNLIVVAKIAPAVFSETCFLELGKLGTTYTTIHHKPYTIFFFIFTFILGGILGGIARAGFFLRESALPDPLNY